MHGALRWRWVALLLAHCIRSGAAVCVGAGQAELANSVLEQTQYCFPKGASLADTLAVRRDAHLCKLYWVVRRGGGRALAAEDVACDEQSRSGPAESDLTQYVQKMLLGLHYCRGCVCLGFWPPSFVVCYTCYTAHNTNTKHDLAW
jgi:hypothetical protein